MGKITTQTAFAGFLLFMSYHNLGLWGTITVGILYALTIYNIYIINENVALMKQIVLRQY